MGMSIDHGVDNFMCYWNLEKKHGPLFFIVLLIVWCIRNEFVFHNKKESLHTSVAKIYSLLKTFVITTPANLGFVTWSWPEEGTVCLNVDGSLQGTTNSAGYGGLIRDNNGNFVLGFYGAV
jgi:hypothetical protein